MPVTLTSLDALPGELVAAFADGDGLLWTGAGVSRRAQEPAPGGARVVGVPTAAAFEAHLARWTPKPHPYAATFESLATLYAARRGRPRLERLLRAVYLTGARSAPAFYARVAALPPEVRVFVTTNYDPFLERALARRTPDVVVVECGLERVSARRPAVYKVHGDAAAPATCVITTPDYDRWERGTDALQAKLATLFLEHTVVALGYRAQDGNFRRLLGAVNARVRSRAGAPRPVYVVIPDAAPEDFAAYDVPEHNLVLVRATGEIFLDWLLERLRARQTAADADALAQLVDPPGVRQARSAVQATRPTAPALTGPAAGPVGPAPATWAAHGEAQLTLAAALDEARRPDDAVRARVDAAHSLQLAGNTERSTAAARAAYHQAVVVRRDARLADGLMLRLTRAPSGLQPVPFAPDDEVAYLAALADVMCAEPGPLPALVGMWGVAAVVLPPDGENGLGADAPPAPPHALFDPPAPGAPDALCADLRRYRAERLRAEYAISQLDGAAAASAFERAAALAPTDVERGECRVRGALTAGVLSEGAAGGPRAAARAALQVLEVPDAVEGVRLRAHAWLAALDGDLAAAAEDFTRAARRALDTLDAVAAAGAYRSAEWAWRQRPDVLFVEEGPGTAAYRLESSVARRPEAPRVSAHELIEEAERSLRDDKTREAWLAAAAAQRLAYDDVDPGNVHRARMALADVWERVLDEGGAQTADEYSLSNALYYAALVHQELDDAARARRAGVLRHALDVRAPAALRARLLRELAPLPACRVERVGVLALLRGLAPSFAAAEVGDVVIPSLRAGLADGWGATRQTNAALLACELFGDVADRIAPALAALVQADLAGLEATTPAAYRERLYVALAQATDVAPTPIDGGAGLAEQLLGTLAALRQLEAARMPGFRSDLGVALAALALRASPPVAARLTEALEAEAATRFRDGLAVLAVRGAAVPTAALDGYLADLTARVRGLTHPANPSRFAMVLGDDPRLTQRAGVDASRAARDATVDAILSLLGEDRQREQLRAVWIGCAVRLAWGTPERRPDVVVALARIASGAFSPSGVGLPFGGHPLSALRMSGLDGGALQSKAAIGLGGLWRHSEPVERDEIRSALLAALDSADPVVRVGAVVGVRSTLPESVPGGSPVVAAGWQVDALVRALADAVPSVQNAARAGLVALVRPGEDD